MEPNRKGGTLSIKPDSTGFAWEVTGTRDDILYNWIALTYHVCQCLEETPERLAGKMPGAVKDFLENDLICDMWIPDIGGIRMKRTEEDVVQDMDGIITQLGEIRVSCSSRQEVEHAEACSEAVNVLYTLLDNGAHTAEEVKDLVHGYKALAKQYQAMYKRFGTAGHAVHKDGVWHCPSCNSRVNPGHSFCHTCGKKLDWIPKERITGRRSRR